MTTYLITIVLTAAVMVAVGFLLANHGKRQQSAENTALADSLRTQLAELQQKAQQQEQALAEQAEQVKRLTAERDVQQAQAANYLQQLAAQKEDYEQRLSNAKAESDAALRSERNEQQQRHSEQRETYEKQLADLRQENETRIKKQQADADAYRLAEQQRNADTLASMRHAYETQIAELKEAHEKQLQQTKDSTEKQIEALKLMNREQVDSQMKLIREQMQTTSEEVLKRRQDELGERNKEQVSKIIDPLQQSLKEMQEAFNLSKSQQSEALTRLDETIRINMQKSTQLGETADRLTRALTGQVKVQGNFGELKLKQLLEDMELREGEQFDTQETLRDKAGRSAKGDDGKGLIPDFILHFPNNRHVVVDSKMSLTDYERYMNAADDCPEKADYLKAHIASVRAQVKRLARKEYTKYLPSGYNRLNFAIMYVPIEGALNLALLNDGTLWREAYDEGVLILGPQTMYMNLRVLEMMWTQVRQLKNQQTMIDAANIIVDRVQDFGMRFMDIESSMNDTVRKMAKLKITTADSGPSIITAAKKLITAGAKENKKKKPIDEMNETLFIEDESNGSEA